MPNYKPLFPDLIDTGPIVLSTEPRPMSKGDPQSRQDNVEKTGGEPLLEYEGNANPYIDYQSIDLLLSLQHPRSPAYDEMCFFIMGQVKELLFRGVHFEIYNARAQVNEGNLENALEILNRVCAYIDYIVNSWNVLTTIKVEGYNEFRDYLATASGQLSFMYRHVEFILGNKNKRLASAHKNVEHIWPAMEEALNSPSLYDAIIAQLHKAGYEVNARALDRDWSEEYQPNDSVKKAWQKVYEDPSLTNTFYRVAEMMITVDEKFSHYRWRHFTAVHKLLGYKPGTGGSAGVGWLRKMPDQRFFPELWDLRNDF